MSLIRALIICVVVCLPVASALSSAAADSSDKRQESAKLIKSLLPSLMEQEDMVGLAIAVVADDQVLLSEAAGVTRLGGEEAVTSQTVFRIASLSKGFAATLSALLVEQGAMEWGDVVATSVPVFDLAEKDESKVTVETLLGQSTGLPHFAYDNLLEAQIKVDRILSRLSEVELMCPVGSCYSYQNVAFSAIAPLVEAKTGQAWDRVMHDTLFQPLGMNKASNGRDALVASSSWAEPHVRTRRGWITGRVRDTYYRVAPASGINASLDDMVIWLKAQMGLSEQVLDSEVLARLHTPRVKSTRELYSPRWRRHRVSQAHYALGWRVFDYQGQQLVFHGGGVAGYRAQIAFMPELKLGMVAMWNSSSGRGWGLLPTLYDRALGLRSRDWMDLGSSAKAAGAAR